MADTSITGALNGGLTTAAAAGTFNGTSNITSTSDLQITAPIGNPLNDWASYTYNWTLWWLDPADFNALASGDMTNAISMPLGVSSYVVAGDSGLYADRRLPSQLQFGLTYNIQEVQFTTLVAPSSEYLGSNLIEGKMTIVEPYGCTFMDTLVAASYVPDTKSFNNWNDQPYLLELNFVGYDDTGMPMPQALSSNALYRKRFPIKFLTMQVSMNTQGATYVISFTASGQESYNNKYGYLPDDATAVGNNVQSYLDSLAEKVNAFYNNPKNVINGAVSDTYVFRVDDKINTAVTIQGQVSLQEAAGTGKTPDPLKLDATLTKGTPMLNVIHSLLMASQYIQNQLNAQSGNSNVPLNSYRVLTQVKYKNYDNVSAKYGREITYNIVPYVSWKGNHPESPNLYADPSLSICKAYKYLYTGQNTDVIDFKMDFNNTWFTSVQTSVYNSSASTPSSVSGAEDGANPKENLITPSIVAFLAANSGSGTIINPTTQVFRAIGNNPNLNALLNTAKNPQAQVAADVFHSMWTSSAGDMVAVKLTINGDPTLIKQDDWLYVPAAGSDYFTQGQDRYQFTVNYGSIPMDIGEVPVSLTVNSLWDTDTERNNAGLGWANSGIGANAPVTSFSGLFYIQIVENTFRNGQFTQDLSLIRYMNSSIYEQAAVISQRNRLTPVDLNATIISNSNSAQVGANPTVPVGR
jgi:hypothetical protein